MDLEIIAPGVTVWHNSIEYEDAFIPEMWDHRYRVERGSEWRDDGRQDPEKRKYYENRNLPMRVSHTPNGDDWDKDDPYDAFMLDLQDVYLECLVEYGNLYPCLFNDLQWQEAHRLLNYVSGAKMGAHSDNTPGTIKALRSEYTDPVAPTRLLVCITFFSNYVEHDNPGPYEYTGGEVYSPYLDIEYAPQRGDTMMYPANYLYAHGVETVLAGNRIANLTVFNQGDFRRLSRAAPDEWLWPRAPWVGGNMFVELKRDANHRVVSATNTKEFPCHPTHF